MKRFISLIAVLMSLLVMTSCEDKVSRSRKYWHAYFKATLVSPSSLEINSERYKEEGTTVTWVIDYSYKNEYGNTVRDKVHIFYIDKGKTLHIEGYGHVDISKLEPYME